jgi:hypothetical protein
VSGKKFSILKMRKFFFFLNERHTGYGAEGGNKKARGKTEQTPGGEMYI